MEQSDRVRMSWIIGAISGLLVLLFVSGIGDIHWLGGAFLGLITFALFGGLLVWLIGAEVLLADDAEASLIEAAALRDAPAVAPVAPAAPAKPAPQAAVAAAPAAKAEAPVDAGLDAGAPDDLKVINGIGPKIEEALAELGVTRFAQIAAWDEAARQDFAARLGRLGRRIEAEDWVGQARALGKGGAGHD